MEGALHLFADSIGRGTVHLIGSTRLTELYAAALKVRSHAARQLDGAAAALAGLARVHQIISSTVETNAV